MPSLASTQDMSDKDRSTLEYVKGKQGESDAKHKQYRERWDIFYGLRENFKKMRREFGDAAARDRDEVLREYQKIFGNELFPPFVFATIEAVVPRVISNDPKMLALPLEPTAVEHVKPMQRQIERDQVDIDYELTLQAVVRQGLTTGLGVQKTYWEKESKKERVNVRRKLLPGYTTVERNVVEREGPQAEWVDAYDWFWDPGAWLVKNMRYCIHRLWRSHDYIEARSGKEWVELDTEKVKGLMKEQGRSEVWSGRYEAGGITDTAGTPLHEVWEYWDGDRVITVLDQALVVQNKATPFFHRQLPFQIYRPTMREGEMVGKGEVEPIAHLQFELNEMRTQRRNAARLALNRGYFYQDGYLDPDKILTGAGVFNPVDGDPRESIMAMPFEDIPASSVSEEQAIKEDIELATGISDTVTGTAEQNSSTTATGTQLVQAAANIRIQLKSKNLSKETLRPAARQWKKLYAQHIHKPRPVRVDDPNEPKGYRFEEITPAAANAALEFIPEGGSQEPENKAEKQQKAQVFGQLLMGFQGVDQKKVLVWILQQLDIPNPESWVQEVVDPEAQGAGGGIDPAQLGQALMEKLVEFGLDEEMAKQAVYAATAEVLQGGGEEPSQNGQPQPQGAPA